MIPIIEDYLSDLLTRKLQYLRDNPNHLEKILSTSQARLNSLKQLLAGQVVINVIKGFPRTPAQVPCFCIILSGEEETQEGLGDYDFDEDVNIQQMAEDVVVSTQPNGRMAIPFSQLTRFPVVDIESMIHVDTGTHMTDRDYQLVNPDLGLVGYYSGLVEDGDTVQVVYNFRQSSIDKIQTLYEANYRVEAWANNGDLVVELYHIAKWALLSGRDEFIDKWDLFNQRLGGADFEPAPSYFPEFVYRRALTFWCQFEASAPTDEVPYISDVLVNETVEFDTSDNGGVDNG